MGIAALIPLAPAYTEAMALGRVTRKITVFGGDEPPLGNHVILQVPNPIRTAAHKRQCAAMAGNACDAEP